jgi:hypothetical protein
MKKSAFLLSLLSLFSLSATANQLFVNPSAANYVQNFTLPAFNKIDISDRLNVDIKGKTTQNLVQAKGDAISVSYVTANVKNGTLYLDMKPNYPVKNGRLSVFVSAPNLSEIHYAGSGQITATHLTGPLTILDEGSGSMRLHGNVNLQTLVHNGSNLLELYWVNSPEVKIAGKGNGKIYLAGIANLLEVKIGGHTWLDAKQLRAKRGFIATNDHARADVWIKDNLSTLAKDNSNIYYYHDAGFVGGYMTPPASVLRMTNVAQETNWSPQTCCSDTQVR